MYIIIDRQTGKQVGKPYASASKARARRDALDSAYGACRYMVQIVEA